MINLLHILMASQVLQSFQFKWYLLRNSLLKYYLRFINYIFSLTGLNRKNIVDTRVHCCLYFIPPYGHGLRQIDLEFLKRLQYKVNIVPVIGKSDTLTKPEVNLLLLKQLRSIIRYLIKNLYPMFIFPNSLKD